jgi:FlaA1/EpsC-like NDP-sugar epimerase
MTIPEAAGLVIAAGAIAEKADLLILDMGTPVPIVELARKMIRLRGLRHPADVAIEFVGLRAGEKLHESLSFVDEIVTGTTQPHIMRVRGPRIPEFSELQSVVRLIEDHIAEQNAEGALTCVREAVLGAQASRLQNTTAG